jgi:hypothetical protein
MKIFKYILFFLVCNSFCFSSAFSVEFQTVSGAEAYQIYLGLPGITCQEYRTASYIVYTKYQTKSCTDNTHDDSKWTCTVQHELKNGKISNLLSADCSRQN